MAEFNNEEIRRGSVCCGGCALIYGIENNGGVDLRFDQPFDEIEGKTNHTVETSCGPLYVRLNMKNVRAPQSNYPMTAPTTIEHYTVNNVLSGLNKAQVGVVLFADRGKCTNFDATKETYKRTKELLEKKLEGIIAYKSEESYNSFLFHREEGAKYGPYCTLYIYDKGLKNEVQTGV